MCFESFHELLRPGVLERGRRLKHFMALAAAWPSWRDLKLTFRPSLSQASRLNPSACHVAVERCAALPETLGDISAAETGM